MVWWLGLGWVGYVWGGSGMARSMHGGRGTEDWDWGFEDDDGEFGEESERCVECDFYVYRVFEKFFSGRNCEMRS